jgi:hypothetical protein
MARLKGQVKAHTQVEHAQQGNGGSAHQKPGWCNRPPAPMLAAGSGKLARRQGDMAHIQPQAEKGAIAGTRPSMKPSEMLAAKPDMFSRRKCAQRAARAVPSRRGDARVVAHGRVEPVQHEPVFRPARDDAGGKQQHAREGGKKQRWAQQVQRLQHMQPLAFQCAVMPRVWSPEPQCNQQRSTSRHHHQHIAQHRGNLRAHQVGDSSTNDSMASPEPSSLSLAAMAGAVMAGCLVAT